MPFEQHNPGAFIYKLGSIPGPARIAFCKAAAHIRPQAIAGSARIRPEAVTVSA
ncbi:hypothetical protein A2U01_0049862, partial [Trifolium medium]|nr:hypothetical protein [Trifolium medium]